MATNKIFINGLMDLYSYNLDTSQSRQLLKDKNRIEINQIV